MWRPVYLYGIQRWPREGWVGSTSVSAQPSACLHIRRKVGHDKLCFTVSAGLVTRRLPTSELPSNLSYPEPRQWPGSRSSPSFGLGQLSEVAPLRSCLLTDDPIPSLPETGPKGKIVMIIGRYRMFTSYSPWSLTIFDDLMMRYRRWLGWRRFSRSAPTSLILRAMAVERGLASSI